MGLFGLSIGGAVDGMKTMLKNNEIIKTRFNISAIKMVQNIRTIQ
jgi:hypothetical protein